MMDIRELRTMTDYRAKSPASLARRLWGRSVIVREDGQAAWKPAYRIYTVTDSRGMVLGKLYCSDAEAAKQAMAKETIETF